jgi:hypothetical protein
MRLHDHAPIDGAGIAGRVSAPDRSSPFWSRRAGAALGWLHERARSLTGAPRTSPTGVERESAPRAPSPGSPRAEGINALPWNEQLQIARAVSDEVKAKQPRRAS